MYSNYYRQYKKILFKQTVGWAHSSEKFIFIHKKRKGNFIFYFPKNKNRNQIEIRI